MAFDNYFIDIGIPEDYERAKRELISMVRNEKWGFLTVNELCNLTREEVKIVEGKGGKKNEKNSS